MALFDQLYEASYKGVTFLCLKTKMDGGRKDIKHEFPNSNNQSIEDLGLKPRSYEITAIITEPNYTIKRDRLLRVLEEGGTGVLVHPFYGRVERIASRTFSLNEDMTKLGDLEIKILFDISDNDGIPTQSINTVSLISQKSSVLRTSMISDITSGFNVTKSFAGNYESAQLKLTEITDTVRTNVKVFNASALSINSFAQLVNDFEDDIPSLITDPERLANSLDQIFGEIPGLYTSAIDQFLTLDKFANFGGNDPLISQNTAARIERDLNQRILNNSVKTFALAENYISAAQIEFETVQEIDAVADQLEEAFQNIKQDAFI